MRRLWFALSLIPALATAAPADLDLRFGTAGVTLGDYAGPTERHVALHAVGAVADGYVALVERDIAGTRRTALARLDARGNETAAVVLDLGTVATAAAHVYPDGRVLVVGATFAGVSTVVVRVHRLRPDGTPDPSFGGGDGLAVVQEDELGLVPTALHVTAAGEIAIAGFRRVLEAPDATGESFVARLSPAGLPVTAFDGGLAHLDVIPFQADAPEAVALLPGGSVLLCDTGTFAGQNDALLTRLRSTGVLDSYGSSGSLYYDTSTQQQGNFNDFCEDIDVQPGTGATVMTVRRSNGILHGVRRVPVDSAGNAGGAFDNVATPALSDAALSFDAQGRAVLAVTSVRTASIDVDLVRFTAAGVGDIGFGVGGTVRHAIPRPIGALYEHLDADHPLLLHDGRGRIVVGATVREDEDDAAGWALMRLMGDAAFADGFE